MFKVQSLALLIAGVLTGLSLAIAALAAATHAPVARPVASLRVGVEPDSLPINNGTRDYSPAALDAALARDLAQHLGATLELVPLPSSQFEAALAAQIVDLVISRHHRRMPVADGVRALRTGYEPGLGVVMRSDTDVGRWQDLGGRIVCSTDDARARALADEVGARLQVHHAAAQALAQVRTGGCAAAIFESPLLDALSRRPDWHKFSATLPARQARPLMVLVSGARAAALGQAVHQALRTVGTREEWDRRRTAWAIGAALETYLDQTGPDCH